MPAEDRRRVVRVAAAVIERQGRFLMTQRRPGTHLAGYWEFPGGKIEAGESVEQALSRELREELGVEIDSPRELTVIEHDYSDKSVHLTFMLASIAEGEPRPLDVEDIGWYQPGEMAALPVLPADAPLIEMLARRVAETVE